MNKLKAFFTTVLMTVLFVMCWFTVTDSKQVMAADDIPDSAISYVNYATSVAYGDPDPVGDLYIYGNLIPREYYSVSYSTRSDAQWGGVGSYKTSLCLGTHYIYVRVFNGRYTCDYRCVGSFNVTKGNINNISMSVDNVAYVLDKYYQQPLVRVDWSGQGNTTTDYNASNAHFSITYGSKENPDNKYAGSGRVFLDATNSDILYGTRTFYYNIKPVTLDSSCKLIIDQNARTVYTGQPITPTFYLQKNQNAKFRLDPDELKFTNNINAGTATVSVVEGNRFNKSVSTTFTIQKMNLDNCLVYTSIQEEYTGSEIKPAMETLPVNGCTLKKGVDYDILGYSDNVKLSGRNYARVLLRGKGNVTGDFAAEFTIVPVDISQATVTVPHKQWADTWAEFYSSIQVVVKGKTLKYDNDIRIERNSGKIFIYGINNYSGAIEKPYVADPLDLSKTEIKFTSSTPVYSGYEITMAKDLYIRNSKGVQIKVSTDCYNVEYKDNINAGNGKLIVTPNKTDVINSKTFTFRIEPRDASNVSLFAPIAYSSSNPGPEAMDNGVLLKAGKDYDVKLDNKGLGPVHSVLTFKGNYTGVREFDYESTVDMAKVKVKTLTLTQMPDATDGSLLVDFVLDQGGYELVEDQDYEVTYVSPITTESTSLRIKATGLGNCIGYANIEVDLQHYYDECGSISELVIPDHKYLSEAEEPYFVIDSYMITMEDLRDMCYVPVVKYLEPLSTTTGMMSVDLYLDDMSIIYVKSFKYIPASLNDAKIAPISKMPYTGYPVIPDLNITIGDYKLEEGKDYKVELQNNIKPGTAKVKITGINYCVGTLETTFVISKDITPTPTGAARPTAVPSGAPTAAPTATPTKKPVVPTGATKPTTTPSADSQIMEFVKRIYIYVLDREPEEEGASFWADELYAFRRTGAEVAQGFIFSPEFEARGTSDEQFVTILYKTFFGRDPEDDGMAFWLSQLSSGAMDRVTVANGFIYSQEWADTCASYGIRSGGDLKPNGSIEPTALTYAFVERMYTTCMGRGYDEEGRQYWASALSNFNVTGEVCGAAFFLSDEMTSYGLSDEEFLNRLYLTFMDRESDADGAAYWLGVMSSGTPRADVVFGFTRSPEFTEKCIEARILPY